MSITAASDSPTITARQLWGSVNTRTDATGIQNWCTPAILPSGGVIVFDENTTATLSASATYLLPCDSDQALISPDTTGNSTVVGFSEPFYASISPQIFALATATVISYILVILIFITPRTFYVGGPGGGGGFLSRHGLSSSKPIVGVGRRPLLQKIATITVAISLTIASADTFHVAELQYNEGYLDSSALVDDVVDTTLIRVVRIISDSFLWLAQVQTLIRLFPRHKEKVTIKWLGFALVSADIIFSILDSFISENPGTRPRSFQDAIPALNYLFELAISLIYASCVVYYSLSKRRFAFWHPKMRNVCLVALVSFISVLIPVVFFVLDISLPKLAGWGEYIRWVGAAAASVVVWEWVERIEALERDARKDGILGREIFDGDEMLDRSSSDNGDWHGRGRSTSDGGDVEKGGFITRINDARAKLPLRRRRKRPADQRRAESDSAPHSATSTNNTAQPLVPPPPAVSPPSRSDTASAASTVYAVRYHNLSSPSPAAPEAVPEHAALEANAAAPKDISDSSTEDPAVMKEENDGITNTKANKSQFWSTVPNPFKRRRAEPPAEVAGAQIASGMRRSPIDRTLNLRDRLGAFAAAQRDRFGRVDSGPTPPLPVTVIPAPRMNDRTWSPDEVRGSSSMSSAARHSAEEAVRGATERDGVVVIPAPARGQTWSPQDPITPGPGRSPNNAAQLTPPNNAGEQVVSTPRGTLTIEEDASRTQRSSPPRRNTYSRRPASRTDSIQQGSVVATSSTAHPPAAKPGPDATGQEGTGTAETSLAAVPASRRDDERARESGNGSVEPLPTTNQADGRDTGGTGGGGGGGSGFQDRKRSTSRSGSGSGE
jgi:hypothetical protein